MNRAGIAATGWRRALRTSVAALCGSVAHSALMYLKFRMGWLSAFQPYRALQITLNQITGHEMHPIMPWILSFLNGSTMASFTFGRLNLWIPGRSGLIKGLVFGIFGWLLMGILFFPLLGMGLFANEVRLGIRPALFSFAMFLTYSVVLGVVYGALNGPRG